MNPFKREQHLDEKHADQLLDGTVPSDLDSDESRALHTYFHQGDFMTPDHDHPDTDY